MFLKILTVYALITQCIVCGADVSENDTQQSAPNGTNCKELNDIFIDRSNDFFKCVLDNNENATFCEDCIEQYANVTVAFHDLMTRNETQHKLKPDPCRARFVDANQLDLVETYFGQTKRLWDMGDCSGKIHF